MKKRILLKWFIYFLITGLVTAGGISWIIALITSSSYVSVFKLVLIITYVSMLIFGAYKNYKS